MQKRIETLIANIDKAEAAIRDGYKINIALLDQESLAIAKALKTKPDATARPLLKQAVASLERLTTALEDRVTALKTKKK